MWKVELPEKANAISELNTALTYVDGRSKYALSEDERKCIIKIYQRYEEVNGIAEDSLTGGTLSDSCRTALYEAYSEVQERNRLKDLRSRLLLDIGLCPCCGISEADELDHHLPRSLYKPLAVYSSNLIPICHKCNNKKRTVSGTNPEEMFVHVYYEVFPLAQQFLDVDLMIQGEMLSAEFMIIQTPGMSDLLFNRLKFQIERIELNRRLASAINIYLSSLILTMKDNYKSGNADGVKTFLFKSAENEEKNFGANHWRTVLLFALSKNALFCDGGFENVIRIRKKGI